MIIDINIKIYRLDVCFLISNNTVFFIKFSLLFLEKFLFFQKIKIKNEYYFIKIISVKKSNNKIMNRHLSVIVI